MQVADAAYVQPFDDLKLPLNVLAGWLFFGYAPAGYLWLGAALILGASLFIMRSEMQTRAGGLTQTRYKMIAGCHARLSCQSRKTPLFRFFRHWGIFNDISIAQGSARRHASCIRCLPGSGEPVFNRIASSRSRSQPAG